MQGSVCIGEDWETDRVAAACHSTKLLLTTLTPQHRNSNIVWQHTNIHVMRAYYRNEHVGDVTPLIRLAAACKYGHTRAGRFSHQIAWTRFYTSSARTTSKRLHAAHVIFTTNMQTEENVRRHGTSVLIGISISIYLAQPVMATRIFSSDERASCMSRSSW